MPLSLIMLSSLVIPLTINYCKFYQVLQEIFLDALALLVVKYLIILSLGTMMLCHSLMQEIHVIVLCTCVPHVGVGVHVGYQHAYQLNIYVCVCVCVRFGCFLISGIVSNWQAQILCIFVCVCTSLYGVTFLYAYPMVTFHQDPILSWQDLMKVGVFLCGLIEVGLGAGNLCCNWHSSFKNQGSTPSQVTLVHKLLQFKNVYAITCVSGIFFN